MGNFEEGERSGKDVLLLVGVAKSFGNKAFFQSRSGGILSGTCGLLGRNGCGKTTLLPYDTGRAPGRRREHPCGRQRQNRLSAAAGAFPGRMCPYWRPFGMDWLSGEGKAREELSRYLLPVKVFLKGGKSVRRREKPTLSGQVDADRGVHSRRK